MDIIKIFDYNSRSCTSADPSRFSKFITHLVFFKQPITVCGKILEFEIISLNNYRTFAGTTKVVDNFFTNKVEVKKLSFLSTISYILK
jgi:hypothetical protein